MRNYEDIPPDWSPASVWYDDDGHRQQTLEFIVPGRPVQKGNIIKNRWGAYHDATKGLVDWLAMIRYQANEAMKGAYRRRKYMMCTTLVPVTDNVLSGSELPMFDSAVMVDVTFVMPRLKKHGKNDPPSHLSYPDIDKLFRSVGDAMTGIVYYDDKQIVEHHARKRYAYWGESSGAIILVTSNIKVE